MGKKKYKRQGSSKYKRVSKSWRKPKGVDSSMRKEKKGRPKLPKVGDRKPKSERGIHPSGYKEVLINNPSEVEDVNPENEAIRIKSTVGKRKKKQILEAAENKDIKVLNPGRRDESGSENAEETSG